MTHKKVNFKVVKALEYLGPGVMEYLSVDKKAINPLTIHMDWLALIQPYSCLF